jgi:hypothetical protein
MGVPTQDGAAKTYFNAYAAKVALDPGKYFLSNADSAAISAAAASYSAAYDAAVAPGEKSELKTIAKDESRNSCEALIRLYSIQIKYNMGISTDDKAALGISQPNPTRTSRDVPPTQVQLGILGSLTGSQTLTYRAPESEGKAKPFGAQTVELRVAIDDEAVTDVNLAKNVGLFSRNPIGVAFEAADNKKVATYWARWANVRGQVGPWSIPVSMTIAA